MRLTAATPRFKRSLGSYLGWVRSAQNALGQRWVKGPRDPTQEPRNPTQDRTQELWSEGANLSLRM